MRISDKRVNEPTFIHAKREGLTTFTSQFPCSSGHYLFYVSNGQCKTCIYNNYQANRDQRIEKMNKYNSSNKRNMPLEQKLFETKSSNLQMRIRYWISKEDSHPLKKEKLAYYIAKKLELIQSRKK